MAPKSPYTKLYALSKETAVLAAAQQLLDWDQETYMPSEAIELRSLQTEALASLIHKQSISPRFAKALGQLINIETGAIVDSSLTPAQTSAAKEWRKDYLKAAKLPNSFVKKFSKTTSQALHVWSKAKKENNFRLFAPHLEKIVALCRKKADLLGFTGHPYDALIDLHEPGMTEAVLTPLFARLKKELSSLLQKIETAAPIESDFLNGSFPAEKQMRFGKMLLEAMGFSSHSSRLDLSSHPFCMGIHPLDTRMTTRLDLENPMSNIFSVIHEGGHGLYNMGRPAEHFGSPLADSVSLGIDESQSRLWETRIGRSYSFWEHFLPKLQLEFPEQLSHVTLNDFYRAVNVVKPSLIRVEADEVTYSLHVIVRFEIECALLEGKLKVKELPEAWNEKIKSSLGITPPSDATGCLQDIHWAMGAIGYFPTYTLGNLYAAQFFSVFEGLFPNWKERIAKGELAFIKEWLREQIHQYGRRYSPSELVMRITGKPLDESSFVSYLHNKYGALYNWTK
jgi:carboxypeptidase Taq